MTRCEICPNEFYPKKKGKLPSQRFCSRKCLAIWNSKREKGSNNPNYKGGNTWWKECELCKTKYHCKNLAAFRIRRFCSQRCGWKMQNNGRIGSNNPNWRGGITEINRAERSSKEHKKWAYAVKKKDNFTCQACGKRGEDLHAHHLLSFEKYKQYRYVVGNGTTLCIPCHYLTYKFHSNQYKKANIENEVNSEDLPDWGQFRAKLLDEINQKKCVTVKSDRIEINSIKTSPERENMT